MHDSSGSASRVSRRSVQSRRDGSARSPGGGEMRSVTEAADRDADQVLARAEGAARFLFLQHERRGVTQVDLGANAAASANPVDDAARHVVALGLGLPTDAAVSAPQGCARGNGTTNRLDLQWLERTNVFVEPLDLDHGDVL